MAIENTPAGDPMPPRCQIIEVRVAELRQLFNTIDPAPFYDRQLDQGAEEFIASRALEVPGTVLLGLMVYVDRPPSGKDDAAMLKEGVHQFFRRRRDAVRQELRELLRRGRISLVIGLAVLGAFGAIAQVLGSAADASGLVSILRESLVIGGWVAMWRPLEVFLYDWWPIRAKARRYDRLAMMPVGVQHSARGESRDSLTPERAVSGG